LRERLNEALEDAVVEGFVVLLMLLVVASGYRIAEWAFQGRKFFGFLQAEYVFHAGDVTVVARFIWRLLKKFND
jgi:hypothetical protein